jgi:hypothetical protein
VYGIPTITGPLEGLQLSCGVGAADTLMVTVVEAVCFVGVELSVTVTVTG